jgi:pyrroloquinoline quinone biosynthesis protein B
VRNRRIYAHVNNSNPLLDPASTPSRALREAGAELAFDGLELRFP